MLKSNSTSPHPFSVHGERGRGVAAFSKAEFIGANSVALIVGIGLGIVIGIYTARSVLSQIYGF